MWETIRGYLTFTKKERYGVLFLLVLVFILFVLPFFLKHSPGDPDPASYSEMIENVRKLESHVSDPSAESVKPDRYPQRKITSSERQTNDGLHSNVVMF